MGWFGFGGSSDKEKHDDQEIGTTFSDQGAFGSDQGNFSSTSLGQSGGASLGSFEQEVVAQQQQAVIKAVIFRLSELAFQKCVTKPSSSLSSSEQSCISAVVTKYLEGADMITSGMQGGHR